MTTNDHLISEAEQRRPERKQRVLNGCKVMLKVWLIQIDFGKIKRGLEGIRVA